MRHEWNVAEGPEREGESAYESAGSVKLFHVLIGSAHAQSHAVKLKAPIVRGATQ